MRIRVFAGIGIAAALLGLTGCRSSPSVAAYIDDTTITEHQVDELIDGFGKSETDQLIARELRFDPSGKPNRAVIVQYLVRDKLCEAARQKLNFQVEQLEIPGEVSELGGILVRTESCERAVPAGAPVKPTQADARQVFDIGVANGIYPPAAANQVIPGLQSSTELANALSRKKTLTDAVAGVDVTINPKYGVVELPLASFQGGVPAVSATFGKSGPVQNRPIQPSAPTQPQ